MSDNKCPPGYILRRGYTRKFKNSVKRQGYTVRRKGKLFTVLPKKNSAYVPPQCIKNRGLPGKGPVDGKGIGALRKGELIKYGYSYRLADSKRQSALKKAMKSYGTLSLRHKFFEIGRKRDRR